MKFIIPLQRQLDLWGQIILIMLLAFAIHRVKPLLNGPLASVPQAVITVIGLERMY